MALDFIPCLGSPLVENCHYGLSGRIACSTRHCLGSMDVDSRSTEPDDA